MQNTTDSDLWLDRWLGHIGKPTLENHILELGCGCGQDTQYLCAKGYRITTADLDGEALWNCLEYVPQANLIQLDLRSPLPFKSSSFSAVIASLCLHYFAWDSTVRIVEDIRKLLCQDGLLIVRANSTKDVNFGAAGFPEIEENYYQVNETKKRFFDEESLRRLFSSGWHIKHVEEQRIARYEMPKIAWELVLRKQPT